jgi:predicted nucleic acid-binding protein
VIYDACVLYPAPLRDFLVELATTGLYRAHWTPEINEEWVRNVLRNRSDLKREQLKRTVDLMNQSVMGCLVRGYDDLTNRLSLPDSKDRHVLAAAIHARADVIVTFNLKDFPVATLQQYGIEPQHPDDFLHRQFDLNQAHLVATAQNVRRRLKNPPKSAAEYLDILEGQQLPQLAGDLRPFAKVI